MPGRGRSNDVSLDDACEPDSSFRCFSPEWRALSAWRVSSQSGIRRRRQRRHPRQRHRDLRERPRGRDHFIRKLADLSSKSTDQIEAPKVRSASHFPDHRLRFQYRRASWHSHDRPAFEKALPGPLRQQLRSGGVAVAAGDSQPIWPHDPDRRYQSADPNFITTDTAFRWQVGEMLRFGNHAQSPAELTISI